MKSKLILILLPLTLAYAFVFKSNTSVIKITQKSAYEKAINATGCVKGFSFNGYVYTSTCVLIKETDTKYYFLTSGHAANSWVAGMGVITMYDPTIEIFTSKSVFAKGSPGTLPMPVKEEIEDHDDLAILEVEKEAVPVKLTPIKLGTHSDNKVFTVGCAGGEFRSLVPSKIIAERDNVFFLNFFPLAGRSGSGVFDEQCEKVLGVVNRQSGECLSSKRILEILKEEFKEVDFSQ